MKKEILDILACPACLPEEAELKLEIFDASGSDVIFGELRCKACSKVFQITNGIAYLLPESVMKIGRSQYRYESGQVLSSYLWSHYADLWGDEDASDTYARWASHLPDTSGFALDCGCAVGRFSFELSLKSDFVVGFDYSRSFISTARRLLVDRTFVFPLIEEGKIVTEKRIMLPDKWESVRVEFIVADAMKPPFKHDTFSIVTTLNLVDKLPRPLDHLKEVDRVARKKGAHLLFSDPFSWSGDVCPEEHWLGGTETGRYKGFGLDNVRKILSGEDGTVTPGWNIKTEGSLWWKIRNHRNHFELIRSHFIRAEK